jgi:hypothetical protein
MGVESGERKSAQEVIYYSGTDAKKLYLQQKEEKR